MRPLWRRLYRGEVDPGFLRRRTGRDQPGSNGDHDWTPGTVGANWDHDDTGPEDQTVRLVPDRSGPRTVVPPRPYVPEDHWSERDRRPLVPEALREPVDAVRFAARHAWYVTAFHVIRVPKYVGLNLLWSPRGLSRLLVGVGRWARVHESRDVEWSAADHAITTRDYGPYARIARERRDQVRSRVPIAALGTAGAAALVVVGLMRWETVVPTVLTVVFGLGWWGRPMDRPYIESAVTSAPQARKITPDMIIMALYGAKLCKETLGPDAPEFVAPGVYRDGPGYGAIVDLPLGYTAEQAIKRKTEIAAGLRVDNFRLFIEQVRGDRGHAGQIKMWIADSDPHTREPTPSPLAKAAKFDLWHEVPFGTDERGKPVAFPLVWTSVLIGALPRMGKSNALRLLLAAAALDQWVRIYMFDGKGGKDFAALEQVCHAFGAGEDDDVAGALVAQLTDLQRDMRERYKRLRRLPDDICPQAKVTPALTRRRDLDMPLTVVAIDEFQVYLENKKYGKTIETLLTSLIKMGPASGIILVLSTQRPSSKVMETDFRDVFGTRFAMRVTTREFSEMILGSGASKIGLDASKFLSTHLGVGILRGTDDGELADQGGRTVHALVMDLAPFAAVCTRARALREGAGTLSGVAAGEASEVLSDQFLPHVIKAFRGEPKAHSDVLCARLAEEYPGLYANPDTGKPAWDSSDLAAALNRYGIRGGNQIWGTYLVEKDGQTKGNQKGFERDPIIEAFEERSPPVPDSPDEWTD